MYSNEFKMEVPTYLEKLPCGGRPMFDNESTIGAYLCDQCFCVIGSMGMPQKCKEMMEDTKK